MSTHKRIDVICAAALALTLALTALFMNGKALGITAIASEEVGGLFTANDLNGEWDTSSATIITLSDGGSKVSGNGAYVYGGDVYIVYAGRYVLSGELTDGSVVIDADRDDKIWISLEGAALHCEGGAPIRVEQADKVFLTLADGMESRLSSGAEYDGELAASGVDGVIYSRDDLTINGSGTLVVEGAYQHGIVCNDDLVIAGGSITVNAAQDGIHANDSVRIRDAQLSISAGDDGITVSNDDETAFLYVESGSIAVTECYEGLEAIDITIAGGTIDIVSADDGINANGSGENSVIRITGGDITVKNPSGRDADGLDSNGSIYIEGGRVLISVSDSGGNCALDYGSENGGECVISGGTVVACGGSAMAEGFAAASPQGFLMYATAAEAGTVISLEDSSGKTLLSEEIPYSFSSAVLSAPGLEVGDACTLTVGGLQEQVTISNTSSSGFAQAGMFGGGMRGGGNRGGMGGPPDQSGFSDGREPPDGMELPDGADAPGGEDWPDRQGQVNGTQPMPDRGQGQGDQTRFPRQGWGQASPEGENPSAGFPAETIALVGISVLVLLIGLLCAVRIKH